LNVRKALFGAIKDDYAYRGCDQKETATAAE
jgi:hypothetical protein